MTTTATLAKIVTMTDRDALLAERESLRSKLAFLRRHVDGLPEELGLSQDDPERCRLSLEAADLALETVDLAEPDPDADTPATVGT